MESRNTNLQIFETSPDVRAFIYQQLLELEPYLTAETLVNVKIKDPLKLLNQAAEDTTFIPKNKLKKMHRISISLFEAGVTLEEEGLSESLIGAILIAKNKLSEKLGKIHDSVISNQDRALQLQIARMATNVH